MACYSSFHVSDKETGAQRGYVIATVPQFSKWWDLDSKSDTPDLGAKAQFMN